jgi:hypothetical protein
MTNEGIETVDVVNFIVAGEGKCGPYLSSQKVRMEGLGPKKHISHDIRSIIPSDMPVGTWVLGAEISTKSGRVGGALVSFDVVEPFGIELQVPEKDVRADVKDVSFGIIVRNNSRESIRGIARIALPIGWELWRNADAREFAVRGGSVTSIAFKAKPPLGALGNVPVTAEVTVGEEVKVAEGAFAVVNP